MFRATVRSLFAHKLRLALTAVSVVLGVAFIAGTLVLTDTLNRTFETLFGEANQGTSVAVRAKAAFESNNGGTDREPIPASLPPVVQRVPGVRAAVGDSDGYAQIVDKAGKVVNNGGAPGLGIAWHDLQELSPLRLQLGRGPAGPGEVAIDAATAKDRGITVGDRIRVVTRTGVRPETVSGIFKFGTTGNLAGATLAAFDPRTAEQVLGTPGTYTSISVAAEPGVAQTTLAERVRDVLPAGVEAISGEQLSKESSSSIKNALSFFNTFLLVFAGIALFVGSFIIFNTFSMLVAQRTRELALLRAIGASRGQVTASLLGEALAVGVIGSTVGLGLGVLVAFGLRALLSAFGATLPEGSLAFLPHTVIWSYLVGVGVTVVAALLPARRAARILPIAALRDDVAQPGRSMRRRAIVGVVVTATGAALMATGLLGTTDQPAALVGAGAAAVFLGIATLSPFVGGPVVRVLGAPLRRLFGMPGKLSRENAVRNPRRTSTTASALMIGIALVSAMSVMGASLVRSANKVIDNSIGADFIVTSDSFGGFSTGVAEELAKAPGVKAVTSFRVGQAQVAGSPGRATIQGVQPATVGKTLNLLPVKGSIASLADGRLLVDDRVATDRKWSVGQSLPVTFSRTGTQTLILGGTYQRNQIAGNYLVSTATFEQNFSTQLDTAVGIKADPGRTALASASMKRVVEAFPGVSVRDQTQYKDEQRRQINRLLGLVIVLLLLAIIIAAFGIVNTLALSVVERTRELGLLRAVGLGRRETRRMIVLESVVIAVFGALLGLAVGVVFGWALVTALKGQGITELAIPVGRLAAYLVVAGLVGVLAALWPARRAARLNVLAAIATE